MNSSDKQTHEEEHKQKTNIDKAEMEETITKIVNLIKKSPQQTLTLKQIKEDTSVCPDAYKSKISEQLKIHKFLIFKQQQKEILFSYSDTAEHQRHLEVQKIATRLLAEIDQVNEVREDKFLVNTQFPKWHFNYTVKQLKKQKKIKTQKDGKLTLLSKYLDKSDSDVLDHLRNQLLINQVQQVSQLKKETMRQFPLCQSKNLTRILKLLSEEKDLDNKPRVMKQKIGLQEYIFYIQNEQKFQELDQLFKQDVENFEKAIQQAPEEQIQKIEQGQPPKQQTVQKLNFNQIVVSNPEKKQEQIQQIIKFLNSNESAKIYYIKPYGKDKEKCVFKGTEESDQLQTVTDFIQQLAEQNKPSEFLTNQLRSNKHLLQFLKIVNDIKFPIKKQEQEKEVKESKKSKKTTK